MADAWYLILGFMLTVYVVLDGFDLGVGALHLLVAKRDDERAAVIRSVGPVWDGNEVWLVAAGGVLFCAFPSAYATALGGFYLPLMLVLWLLIFRGLAIELRGHVGNPLWKQLWDALFSVASALLAFFLGVALGNVVRGVDLDSRGRFFAPFWTDLRTSGSTGILDWYTSLVGALAVASLALHGAAWLGLRTTGEVRNRSILAARKLNAPVAALFVAVSAATAWVSPHIAERVQRAPWSAVLFALPLAALWLHRKALRRRRPKAAFKATTALLVAMLGATLFGTYPYILPASTGAVGTGITAQAAATGETGLETALSWWIPAIVLAAIYPAIVYRSLEPAHEPGAD